jgi:hypothetical protein
MTELGLCHNANYAETRLTTDAVERYRPRHARTITYWSDDLRYYRRTLESCRELAAHGVTNLVVFNTEAFGGAIKDIDLMAERLHAFLKLAQDEYDSPVHAIEPLNEIDTPNWDDGAGGPLTTDLILEYTYRVHSVATEMFEVETLGPSFLGGPSSELPVAVLGALAADGRIKTAAFHMYGRSVGDEPSPGWLFGTVEQGIAELEQHIGDMQVDLTEGGCWTVFDGLGEEAQRRFVEALCAFQHPRVRRNYLFAYNDACCSPGELEVGKDFGLEDVTGRLKLAAAAFRGDL